MLKNFINRVKSLVEQNKVNKESTDKNHNDKIIQKEEVESQEIIIENDNHNLENYNSNQIKDLKSEKSHIEQPQKVLDDDNNTQAIEDEVLESNENEALLNKEDLKYIKDIKIKRGMSVKAIDVYTKEHQIFKNHKECSKKLKIPVEYIQENLKYGYTDYLGQAIKYLGKELNLEQSDYINYLDGNKTPSQMLSYLNNKIFTAKISKQKREEILCSENIEPVKMHYIFECMDEEYDDYFRKYKSIIKRGGKKKIELVDKKGEVIEIFKSLDECANYLEKEKSQVVQMLKYKETKVGRYEIRYSLRNI